MREIQSSTFPTFFCGVFSFIATNCQHLEHHWIVKIVLLAFPGNIALVLFKINEQFRRLSLHEMMIMRCITCGRIWAGI